MWAAMRSTTPPRQALFDWCLDGHPLQCEVTYSPRRKRSIAVRVLAPDRLRVLAPGHYSQTAVLEFLHSRRGWIERQLQRLARQTSPWSGHVRDGSIHPWQGRPLTLQWQRHGGKRLKLIGNESQLTAFIPRHLTTAEAEIRLAAALERWYLQQAEEVFSRRLNHWVAHIGWLAEAPTLKLRKMKSRWGSCSSRGHITLNTQLIKTPPECLDYVIVHELCHLREMNHSPAFHALQAAVLPDWKARKQTLQDFPVPE